MKLSTLKTKLHFTYTLLIFLASLLLTACGDGGTSGFTTTPHVTNSPSDTTTTTTASSSSSYSAANESAIQNKLTVSWTYDNSTPDIAGFKVYDADNNEVCQTAVADDRLITCDFSFSATGDQTFTITAYDIYDNESAHSAPITANKAPVAVLQLDGVDNLVSLDASQSSDLDSGSIVEYAWDFGDGNTYTGESIIHEYQPGTYTVSLTVKDDQDATSTTEILLTIV